MKGDQHQIKKATEEIGASVGNAKSKEYQQMLQKAAQGSTPKDAMGLTDAMVEGIYGQAYRLYNTGKYKDASQLFRLLIMLNTTEPKYAMGLAACFHMLKEYRSAVDTYTIVSMVNPENPVPFFHASDCMIQMGDNASAIIALEMAIKRSGEKPEFRTLKDRALLTIQSLKKEAPHVQK